MISPPSNSGERTVTSSERAQTDESLRVERETADDASLERVASIEEAADAVISLARARADDVLAAARASADNRSAAATPQHSPDAIRRERVLHDNIVHEERETADESLHTERVERMASLLIERDRTDSDLFTERSRADGALATRDEFLAVVSHDLRDMLDAMVRFAVLIEKDADRGGQVRMHARRIRGSGTRMARLIGDLVDVASIEAGALAVTRELADPSAVLAEAIDRFEAQASANGVSLLAESAPAVSPAAFDPARILQVLSNLLSNAIKFTPAGGKVTARVERIGDEIRFSVTDTGIGMPSDKLDAVFERFVQVERHDRRGVGLGLYISKCIVLGHGGHIWAESAMGQGSTVCFTLPSGGGA